MSFLDSFSSEKKAKWSQRYIDQARFVANWSEDESTQCGAVIVCPNNRRVDSGYNGLPRGVELTPERQERPIKYEFFEHAERNAIFNADFIELGSTMFLNYSPSPCPDCARAIIQKGITTIVGPAESFPGKGKGTHYDVHNAALAMLKEAGVCVLQFDEKYDLLEEIV